MEKVIYKIKFLVLKLGLYFNIQTVQLEVQRYHQAGLVFKDETRRNLKRGQSEGRQ